MPWHEYWPYWWKKLIQKENLFPSVMFIYFKSQLQLNKSFFNEPKFKCFHEDDFEGIDDIFWAEVKVLYINFIATPFNQINKN